ncbi:MAG: hypothetical protein Q8R18_00870 [bacterium]|nr:hypothetical protein [bacterium]
MEEQDIFTVLKFITQHLDEHSIVWRIDGSANLRVQGVDVNVHDLDIKTNAEGLRIFKEVFKNYFVQEFYKEEIKGDVLEFEILGFPVEVINNKYNLLNRIKKISLQGMFLPVLPLREAREFYAATGKEKTVTVLDRHLS